MDHKEKVKIAILLFFMSIAAILEVLSVISIPSLVDILNDPERVIGDDRFTFILNLFGVDDNRSLLIFGAIFVMLAFVLKNVFLVFYRYISTKFIFMLYSRLGDKLFQTYMDAPYTFHLGRNSAELLRNVTQETQLLIMDFLFSFLKFLMDIAIIGGILLLLLYVDPIMTIIVFAVLGGGSMLFMRSLRSMIKKYGIQEQKYRGKMIQSVNEGLGGLKNVKVMRRTKFFKDRFQHDLRKTSKSYQFKEFISKIIIPSVETFAVIGMLLMALFLMVQGRGLESILSVLVLFVVATARLMPAFKKAVNHFAVMKYYSYVVDPVYDDLTKIRQKIKEDQDFQQAEELLLKNEIVFDKVVYFYPNSDEKALNEISLKIKKNQIVAFVGSSGAGKTTIVDVLLGLLQPMSGSVRVDNINIFSRLESWQKNIGYIPQFIFLSDDSIRKNIAFGITDNLIDDDKIEKAMRSSQLYEFVDKMPDGVETVIGEGGVRLSGGQRQRIGIARALYHEPEVLIMDEATSALDNETERNVMAAINKLKPGRTIIIIAHRLTTVRNADNIFLLQEGKLAAEGTYDELLEKSETFNSMAADI